jgi:putative ABC transport system substrate-binding protein
MRRRDFLALVSSGALCPRFALAQQPGALPHIGFLGATTASGYANQLDGLRAGLRDFGYIEGKTIRIDYRWAMGKYDRLNALASELVNLKVALIVTHGTPCTQALKNATTTIPIVMAVSGDAVKAGLVDNLARPGGNVTGQSYFGPELAVKRLSLILDVNPRARRVAFVQNPINAHSKLAFDTTERFAGSRNVMFWHQPVRSPQEFAAAFASLANGGADLVSIDGDGMLTANASLLANLALQYRLPSIGEAPFAGAGGLIGYGPNYFEMFRRAAFHVDQLLKGAKVADLPVEQPKRFELIINKRTAQLLAISIPNSLLLQQTSVIT